MVNFRKLSQDWRMDRLKEGERLLGAHHTTRSGFGYGAMAKYNSMEKHFVQSGWEIERTVSTAACCSQIVLKSR
jgi:hypothetical protein